MKLHVSKSDITHLIVNIAMTIYKLCPEGKEPASTFKTGQEIFAIVPSKPSLFSRGKQSLLFCGKPVATGTAAEIGDLLILLNMIYANAYVASYYINCTDWKDRESKLDADSDDDKHESDLEKAEN